MDIFTWSVPFLVEKVLNMIFHIIQKTAPDEDSDNEDHKVVELMQEQAEQERKN